MGFEDELAQARRGGSDNPPKPDYKIMLDQFAEQVFKAIDVSSGKWGRAHLEETDVKAGQERVEGTTHMLLDNKDFLAFYWIDVGDNRKITVDFRGHIQGNGNMRITAAEILVNLDPSKSASLDNFKKELLKLAKKS